MQLPPHRPAIKRNGGAVSMREMSVVAGGAVPRFARPQGTSHGFTRRTQVAEGATNCARRDPKFAANKPPPTARSNIGRP